MTIKPYNVVVATFFIAITMATTFPEAAKAQTPALLLFGGNNHKVFLGCLNCNRFDQGSVCNRYASHGSRFSSKSIWNGHSIYGSRYSTYSPWNRHASNPPVIVDRDGNFYGYFTANRFHARRTTSAFFLAFLDNVDEVNNDRERARDIFCGD